MAVLIGIYYDLTCRILPQSSSFMQLMAWDPPQLQTDVRRRRLASARPEPLSARRTNAVLTVKGLHGLIEIAEVRASTFLCFSFD